MFVFVGVCICCEKVLVSGKNAFILIYPSSLRHHSFLQQHFSLKKDFDGYERFKLKTKFK